MATAGRNLFKIGGDIIRLCYTQFLAFVHQFQCLLSRRSKQLYCRVQARLEVRITLNGVSMIFAKGEVMKYFTQSVD